MNRNKYQSPTVTPIATDRAPTTYLLKCQGKHEARYLSDDLTWVARPLARVYWTEASAKADLVRFSEVAPAPLSIVPMSAL